MKDGGSRRRRPNKLKIVCSFNGEFQPRLPSGKLRYVGGEARIVSMERNIGFSRLKSKILELHRCTGSDSNSISSFSLMYHLPCAKKSAAEEDSPLVLVTCDDDVTCMIEEYGELEMLGMDPRLWIFVCYDDHEFVKPNVLGNFGDLSRIAVFNGNRNGGDVRKDAVQAVYDYVCADDKVKKQTLISGSNRVKSGSNDSLRKIVLKQQLLANQSSKIVSSYTDPRLDIVKINGSYRCKYTGADILESEVFGNLGSLPASHSCPLNPTDFNVRVISNGSQQADLTLGNSSDCNLDQSEGGQYLKSSCNPSMNRENIVPRGVDHGAPRMRFLADAISYPGKPGNGIVHGDIQTHGPDLRDTRNPRAFPYHFRSHRSAVTETRNSKFNRLDGRSMVGCVGLRSASEVSKQGQTAAPCSLTWKLPSYYGIDQGELVARAGDFGLHNQKCSFNLQNGSQKNIIDQASPEGLQLGKLDLEGCHLADQSLLLCDAVNNSSACTKILDGQIDLTHGLGSKQHEVQQEIVSKTLLQASTNDEANNVINKPINVKDEQEVPSIFGLPISDDSNGGYKSFIQNHDDSEAALTPQLKHLDTMDEEYFSSGPQVEKSSGTTCISSSHIMAEDNDEKPEDQQYLQYSVGIDEKDKIKKTNICVKINGGLHDADRAAFYTHLATKELQTINKSDLEYIKELGSGAYGTVFYGKWKGSDVAIKKLKRSRFSEDATDDDRLVADFWKEAYLLGQLHHPNIVALYGVVADGPVSNFAVVTEYMVNGSLKQVLLRKDRTIDRRKRLIIALDAAFAMEYLHEKNIIHFDLKSHNFLVNMRDPLRPVCKIGDLGLSKIKQRTLVSGGVRGTIPWMAPELLNAKKMVNEKVDIYSFGIVMWELLTGEEPYANMKPKEIIAGIIENTLRPKIPSWCDPAWRLLMERCWSSDSEVRPSFSEISKELRVTATSMNIK